MNFSGANASPIPSGLFGAHELPGLQIATLFSHITESPHVAPSTYKDIIPTVLETQPMTPFNLNYKPYRPYLQILLN